MGPGTYIDHVPSAELITLFDSALTANQSAPAKPSEALELLRQDIAAHNDQKAHKSYLGYALSAVTSLGRTDTFAPVEQLNDQLRDAVNKGDTAAANKLAVEARAVVDADKQSMTTDQLVSQYGSGMVKTAGLFIPSKAGYAISGLAYALDQAKPGDSLSNQLIDGGLGLTKGVGLKGTFDHVGAKDMGIALKAVSLGISSRVIDSALTRQTYTDGDGYSAAAGLSKTFEQSFNRTALASDVITFGLAHGALSGINGITGGALRSSPFFSTIATGGVFGVSAGSVSEINRQQQAGEKFDLSKILTSAALTGATDMIAAGPGARMASVRASAFEHQNTPDVTTTTTTTTLARAADSKTTIADTTLKSTDATLKSSEQPEAIKVSPILQRNFAGSSSREFQLVNADQQVIEQLRSAPNQFVLAPVREVSASGLLGPQKNLMIQHLEATSDGSSVRAVNQNAFAAADLLATCNPALLPKEMIPKHIMPSADGVFVTQDPTGRLRFTDTAPSSLTPGESQPLKLDGTVSELLRSSQTPKYIENTHDKTAIAKAMENFKTPVRYLNSGVDNIAFEMPDKSILKVTDHGWDPTWGHRTIWTPNGTRRFDAQLLRKPETIQIGDTPVTYFIQKRLISPVSQSDLRYFDSLIEQDGKYKFWDNDFSAHGKKQLGIDPDTRQLFLIDYDAVRLPRLVPKFEAESPDSLVDRILDRYND